MTLAESHAGTYQNPIEALDFERDATTVLEQLRPALADVVEHLQPRVARAAELRRRLKLSQKVSWGLFTAATARDARALPALLPGRAAMGRFFDAVADQGVPPEVIDRAREAFTRFEETVARHASSRDDFETMVSELDGGNGEAGAGGPGSADLKHKRSAFRANALLWGRKAEISCGVRIVGPSTGSGSTEIAKAVSVAQRSFDSVLINGMVGLQRTRRGVSIQTTERRWTRAMSAAAQAVSPEPLDPRETGPQAIGLLHDFCSQPLPDFRLCESNVSYRKYELMGEKLGASGEVTFFTGEVSRGVAPFADVGSESRPALEQFRGVGMPMAMYIGDMLVHKSLCDAAPPQVEVYAWPLDGPTAFRASDLMPLTERAEYLGEGIDAARTPLIPRYSQMLAFAMERMGWNPDDFRVFRCRVEYPLLHTRIKMTLPVARLSEP
jgi:hypothetical protein